MAKHEAPKFGELDRAACEALLERHSVGRLAFAFHGRVGITPVHYVFADGWIWGRTAPGAKLLTLQHHPYAAFEVDEVEGLFEWRSVVVHGTVYLPDKDDTEQQRASHERGVMHLRALYSNTFAAGDAAPDRTQVFHMHTSEMTGRYATTHTEQ